MDLGDDQFDLGDVLEVTVGGRPVPEVEEVGDFLESDPLQVTNAAELV
jgi:hypothetical protein